MPLSWVAVFNDLYGKANPWPFWSNWEKLSRAIVAWTFKRVSEKCHWPHHSAQYWSLSPSSTGVGLRVHPNKHPNTKPPLRLASRELICDSSLCKFSHQHLLYTYPTMLQHFFWWDQLNTQYQGVYLKQPGYSYLTWHKGSDNSLLANYTLQLLDHREWLRDSPISVNFRKKCCSLLRCELYCFQWLLVTIFQQ